MNVLIKSILKDEGFIKIDKYNYRLSYKIGSDIDLTPHIEIFIKVSKDTHTVDIVYRNTNTESIQIKACVKYEDIGKNMRGFEKINLETKIL